MALANFFKICQSWVTSLIFQKSLAIQEDFRFFKLEHYKHTTPNHSFQPYAFNIFLSALLQCEMQCPQPPLGTPLPLPKKSSPCHPHCFWCSFSMPMPSHITLSPFFVNILIFSSLPIIFHHLQCNLGVFLGHPQTKSSSPPPPYQSKYLSGTPTRSWDILQKPQPTNPTLEQS